MVIVICGPSGAGKGSVVARLLEADPSLWVSRSWTTRPRRPGEPADAYTFVDRATFEAHRDAGGFLEWAEVFGGHLYGTPVPDETVDGDVILEIDIQGAEQIRAAQPDTLIVLIVPPSRAEQERRLRDRGDVDDQLAERLAKADAEEDLGRQLADEVVINDDLDRAVATVAGIVTSRRAQS